MESYIRKKKFGTGSVIVQSAEKKRIWDSIESAEQVQQETLVEQKHNADVLRDKFIVLKFFCYNCHAPHYWGGEQRSVGMVNYSHFCPKIQTARDYRNILLEKKYMDVPMVDALALAPRKG